MIKTLILISMTLFSTLASADTVLFSGTTEANQSCSLVEAGEEPYTYLVLELDGYEYSFLNQALDSSKSISFLDGFFQKSDDGYDPIIGAAMFPIGDYADLTVKASFDQETSTITSLTVKKTDKLALVFGFTDLAETVYNCSL